MSQARRKAGRQPAPRTTTVTVSQGDFAGWEAVCLVSFPAGWLVAMQSGDFARILEVLAKIIRSHNFPAALDPDQVATSLEDVDLDGLLAFVDAFGEALKMLPPR